MFYAGVDVGSRTAKAIILHDGRQMGSHLISTGADSAETSKTVLEGALRDAGLEMGLLKGIVTTGYGRYIAPFPHESITEIACHTRGVHQVFPSARTILDMGGQDCKAIRLNESGDHINFVMNDKCAAGTGRFLEVLARSLDVRLEEMTTLALGADDPIRISSVCAVFAKEEALSHRRRGVPLNAIIAGVLDSVAERVFKLINVVGLEEDFVITGGIALNAGVVRRIEQRAKMRALIPPEPQLTGAMGAAWLAKHLDESKLGKGGYA